MDLYGYPSDPEATSSYYQPAPRITPRSAGSARATTSPRATPGADSKLSTQGPKVDAAGWAGAAAGTLGLAADVYGMTQQRFNFGNIEPSQTDYNSAPVYTAGQMYNEVSGAKPKGAGAGEILSGAGQGAAIGTSILPGIGTAVGAGVGALATAVGGAVRRNKQDTEKNRAMTQVLSAQNLYNQQDEDYRQRQNQLYDYYNQNNAQGREYNVYRSRFNS